MVTVLTIKARPRVRAPPPRRSRKSPGRATHHWPHHPGVRAELWRQTGVRPQGHFRGEVQDQAAGCRPGASWSAWPSDTLLRQWAGVGKGPRGPLTPTPGSSLCFPWGPPPVPETSQTWAQMPGQLCDGRTWPP